MKLVELKQFNGNIMLAQSWLSTLKYYFIAVGIAFIATKAADKEAVC